MKAEFREDNEVKSKLLFAPFESWPKLKGIDQGSAPKQGRIASTWLPVNGGYHLLLDLTKVQQQEAIRKAGAAAFQFLSTCKVREFLVETAVEPTAEQLSFIQGFLLAGYTFSDRKTAASDEKCTLVLSKNSPALDQLLKNCEIIGTTRDLVNQPFSHLGVQEFCDQAKQVFPTLGVRVEVLEKKQLEALKMGGILGVNKGSVDPPALLILEWTPEGTAGQQPIVLVGKGVVYDTGGLSLKPTKNSMDMMKCDMGGGAAVFGAINLVAANRVNRKVVGLIPLTDNRPGGAAIAPGDVLTMASGTTVEVMNTDAEGRLILADALHYAHRYDPSMVIDMATLTGSAVAAIGQHAAVIMGTADQQVINDLLSTGETVGERLVQFPFWEEYGEELKSEVADLSNLGGPTAGAITAGKFLEHFTKSDDSTYPWLHIDLAGPSYIQKPMGYWTTGGTGYGAQLMFEYIKNHG